jgi:hypothetical protein
MSTPQANPEGYKESSVMAHAHKISGKLLLVGHPVPHPCLCDFV